MTMLRLLGSAFALVTFAAHAVPDLPDDDPGCARRLEEAAEDWTDAQFAAEAGRGISTILNIGFEIAQIWRLGPKTAYVIARLDLIDPATNDLGLKVSAFVKDGALNQLNELDARICFGLARDGEPDWPAIRNLDRNLGGHAAKFVGERLGIDRARVETLVGPKIVAGGVLNVMVIAAYRAGGQLVRRRILARVSRADGTRLEDLTPD